MFPKIKLLLKRELSAVEWLYLIKMRAKGGEFVIDLDILKIASVTTCLAIRFCEQNALISIYPMDTHHLYAFCLTQKGNAYLKDTEKAQLQHAQGHG